MQANYPVAYRTGRPTRLRYDFTVDDPATFTRPWSGALLMTRAANRIYEYACHEGNYSMVGTLRGARAADAKPGVR